MYEHSHIENATPIGVILNCLFELGTSPDCVTMAVVCCCHGTSRRPMVAGLLQERFAELSAKIMQHVVKPVIGGQVSTGWVQTGV